MGQFEKIVYRVLGGSSDKNIKFDELLAILKKNSFDERIKGSHRIFFRTDVTEIINLQPGKDGKAKPYQVKQVRDIILKYKLMIK